MDLQTTVKIQQVDYGSYKYGQLQTNLAYDGDTGPFAVITTEPISTNDLWNTQVRFKAPSGHTTSFRDVETPVDLSQERCNTSILHFDSA